MSNAPNNPYAPPASNFGQGNIDSPPGPMLATRLQRFLGALVDGIILFPLSFVAGMGLGLILTGIGFDPSSPAFFVAVSVLGFFLNIAIFLGINGYLLATRGQTIGKVVLNTRIVSDENGGLVPMGPLYVKRYLPIQILGAIPFVGIVVLIDALAIFRENHKCIHDDIAGTKVIQIGS